MWVIAITLNNKYWLNNKMKTGDAENWGRNTYLPVFAGEKTGDAT